MRKISKTLALMSLLAPLGANALGIGDIRLHSALNQSLNAEIPLVTSGSEELSDIRVTLASPEAFARAGIERHYSLSKLRFAPQQKADGSYIIKVTSQESVHEPFLNFMIEVYWPQGRMQREFTVLLDPPASFQENESAEEELPEAETYERPVVQPVRRPSVESVPVAKPRRSARVIEAAPQPSEPPAPVTGTQYGPISRSETLWSIAKQYNPDPSISQDKMLKALYRANPRAFYKSNVNALKAGATITIPDRESVLRLAGSSGVVRSGRTPAVTQRPESVAGEVAPQGQLKLLAPTETGKSRDETATSGSIGGRAGRSKDEMAQEVATVKQENEEIRRSLIELKEQMQRLLTLKDEQIATLQAQQQAKPITQPNVQPSVPTPQPTVPPVSPNTGSEKPIPAVETTRPLTPPVSETKPTTPPVAPKPVETVRPATPPPVRPVAKPPTPKPAAPKQEEAGILSVVSEYPSAFAIAGILATLGTMMWWVKRRRAAMIDDTESILTLSDREKMLHVKRGVASLDQPSVMSEPSTTTARSSFLSEFTPSDFDALGGEMEEVDPISEADVYLAYGRYKQAEELIHTAIEQNPERDECKLKLFEIYYATENGEAFEKFAEDLMPTHKLAKPEFWEKIAEMGQELCPSSPLFTDGLDVSKPAATAQAKKQDYLFEAEEKSAPVAIEEESDQSSDKDSTENALTATIDYDFFATAESAIPEAIEEETPEEPLKFENAIDYEVTPPSKIDEETIDTSVNDVQDKTLDDILAELGVLSEAASSKPAAPAAIQENQEEAGNNVLDFEFGLHKLAQAEIVEEVPQFEEEETGSYMALTDMDEQETKLDLAKAYFDMGETEAAKAILEDVAEHGNDAQREEAWALLNKFATK